MVISKSDYLLYLSCKNEFWLKKNKPEIVIEELSSTEENHRLDQANKIENLAIQLLTRKFPQEKIHVQSEFEVDNLTCRSDVLIEHSNGEYDLYEIKSTATVKEQHLHDASFQKMVLGKAGVNLKNVFIVYINATYVFDGELIAEKLLAIEDVTLKLSDLKSQTEALVKEAISYLETTPQLDLKSLCASKLNCPFVEYSNFEKVDYSIFDISNFRGAKMDELLELGILNIMDVPIDFSLTERQREQVNSAQQQIVTMDKKAITEIFDGLQYPLYFYDYESYQAAIPLFNGVRPYQQIVFQFSMHVLKSENANVEHFEYLSSTLKNPDKEIINSLKSIILDRKGTFIVWNETFEKTRNKELSAQNPESAEFLDWINDNTFDLMTIFSTRKYVHYGFRGSSSIKKVLPVLVPELSHSELAISEGMEASISWYNWVTENPIVRNKATRSNLLEYCKLDTLAMVEIFKKIKKEISEEKVQS